MTDTLLSMQAITKSFPGVLALDDVTLEVNAGEIHGLVGENGAGKSTIIKVLAGVYSADAGRVAINGAALADVSPKSVHDAGVRFIHQELHLVPHFTVTESVFMGQELSGPLGLQRRKMRQMAEAFFEEALGTTIAGNRLIRDLGIAERKLVQIARALIDGAAKLVVFDEPTAPLTSEETDRLFTAIRKLKERGIAMIYVSHYLAEITGICDRVTVLRNGKNVRVFDEVCDDSAPAMINAMVGREIADMFPETLHAASGQRLQVKGLSGDTFQDVSFDLQRGEIVGIAGLIGSGREELIDTLYGLRRAQSGTIRLNDQALRVTSPSKAVSEGIVLVPRDRRNEGLVLDMSASDNLNLASLNDVSTGMLENRRAAADRAAEMSETLDIRPRAPATAARLFSGGNQQKIVLGRWLTKGAEVFILDEPTVGVDIGAKVEIYHLIEGLARDGASVLVSSSDPAELIGLCSRILVMLRGDVIAEVRADGLGLDALVAMTTGGDSQVTT